MLVHQRGTCPTPGAHAKLNRQTRLTFRRHEIVLSVGNTEPEFSGEKMLSPYVINQN
jgi:hypothetical protein